MTKWPAKCEFNALQGCPLVGNVATSPSGDAEDGIEQADDVLPNEIVDDDAHGREDGKDVRRKIGNLEI